MYCLIKIGVLLNLSCVLILFPSLWFFHLDTRLLSCPRIYQLALKECVKTEEQKQRERKKKNLSKCRKEFPMYWELGILSLLYRTWNDGGFLNGCNLRTRWCCKWGRVGLTTLNNITFWKGSWGWLCSIVCANETSIRVFWIKMYHTPCSFTGYLICSVVVSFFFICSFCQLTTIIFWLGSTNPKCSCETRIETYTQMSFHEIR